MSKTEHCGCQRGFSLCPEAVRLWDSATATYRRAMQHPGDPERWTEYEQALDLYDQHMIQAEQQSAGQDRQGRNGD